MTTDRLLLHLRRYGPTATSSLVEALGTSRASVARAARRNAEIVSLGRTRAQRYAARLPVAGLPTHLPVHRIDADGHPTRVGTLVPLWDGRSWLESREGAGALYDGLPPVIADMLPAGFLGRGFASRCPELALPDRLQDWSDADRIHVLARRGEDLPGDLVVGMESLDRWLQSGPVETTRDRYEALARSAALGTTGSSAGGEQPKFTAFVDGRHLLVKFSEADGRSATRRWRDLLVCEAIASEVLREAGIPAAHSEVVDVGTRRFLEVERFDRVGARGRVGVCTLDPLEAQHFGQRGGWGEAAARFVDARLLGEGDARTVRLLEAFSMCIANGDRHFGNLAFFVDGVAPAPVLRLAPAYDVLPMSLAPRAGELPEPPAAARPIARLIDVWDDARRLADEFWGRVRRDARIGDDVRALADGLVAG